MRWAVVTYVILLLTLTTTSSAQGRSDPSVVAAERDLRRIEQEYVDARLRGDSAAVARLIATDFAGITSAGRVEDREVAITALRSTPSGATIDAMTLDSVEVHVAVAGSAALIIGRRRIKTSSGEGQLRFLHVYARDGKNWQLIASSTTPIR